MDINDYRVRIDQIDTELLSLLEERMRVAEGIAQYKKENSIPITDAIREREVIEEITDESSPDLAYYNRVLFTTLMEMSKDHQAKVIDQETQIAEDIKEALKNSPKDFPERPLVACQGVEGAYSQEACGRIFKMPKIMFMKNFRGVFAAINGGLCQYGILPIENSTAGSVNQVYDLMMEYNFHIVKSIKVKINHSLLSNKGAAKESIRDIYSHPQALAQCDEYIKKMPMVTVHVCENTAEAAKMVAESGRTDVAAIASSENRDLYGLEVIEEAIQDNDNNYTRFICITKDLEIFPGANRTSLMLVTNHKPGSLYQVLARFNAMGINIIKLESRPIPSTDFEFMFYFDIDEFVYSDNFIRMINQLNLNCREFIYLGSYIEL